jgi:hypothetical protein
MAYDLGHLISLSTFHHGPYFRAYSRIPRKSQWARFASRPAFRPAARAGSPPPPGIKINVDRMPTHEELVDAIERSGLSLITIDLGQDRTR